MGRLLRIRRDLEVRPGQVTKTDPVWIARDGGVHARTARGVREEFIER